MGLIVYERELKKLGGFRWNPNGFVLIEFGPDNRNHFRLDLANQNGRGKRVYSGGDYIYEVTSIHLKSFLGTGQDDTHTYWLYYYVAYVNAGVWKWTKDYVKDEITQTKNFTHMTAPEDDAQNGYVETSDFIEYLGKLVGSPQTLSNT
ncbi:hypothetical protein [Neoroseomonas soli]|uniref:Uncharacterized protein n=1 Tax=Neoroseomonas soli TaxID=1081025 RepID=A0A9X9WWH3_9PROT|nr:hypothetical protein [Neoroseomonas soli]MBR0671502.1 hypothetical protein [Neoroseomonas soli]